jgi:hypothetical protein
MHASRAQVGLQGCQEPCEAGAAMLLLLHALRIDLQQSGWGYA